MKKLEKVLDSLDYFMNGIIIFFGSMLLLWSYNIRSVERLSENYTSSILECVDALKKYNSVLEYRSERLVFFMKSHATRLVEIGPYFDMLDYSDSSNTSEVLTRIEDIKTSLNKDRKYNEDLFENILSTDLSDKYLEKLSPYLLETAKIELRLRYGDAGTSICCGGRMMGEPIINKVGDEYEIYPNVKDLSLCNSYVTINGEKHKPFYDYKWTPKRRGMHYFEVVIINFAGYKLEESKFQIGIKVT